MASLHAIPVRAEVRGRRGSNIDIARRLLADIETGLARFLDDGRASAIDLRHVPHMTPETYGFLREQLGSGEVTCAADTGMRVEIAETGFPGVWWISHHDAEGEVVTQIIEITDVPSILRASRAGTAAGLARLRKLRAGMAGVPQDAETTQTLAPPQGGTGELP